MRLTISVAIFSAVTISCDWSSTSQRNDEVTRGERATNTLEVEYGNCPEDPNELCGYYHGGAAVPTSWCTYGECFDMSYGDTTRVVAADGFGAFPRTFFVWVEGASAVGAGAFPCVLTKEGKKKTRVQLPEGSSICQANIQLGPYTYYEHFASAPEVGCLGWIECKALTP